MGWLKSGGVSHVGVWSWILPPARGAGLKAEMASHFSIAQDDDARYFPEETMTLAVFRILFLSL